MKKTAVLLGITCFWLVMMHQLMQREFFALRPVRNAYEVLPIYNLFLREEYHGIYIGKELLGFNRLVLEKLDRDADQEPASETNKTDKPEIPDAAAHLRASRTITSMDDSIQPRDSTFELRDSTYMTFKILGMEREMLVRSRFYLDAALEMNAFELKMSSGKDWTEIAGQITGKTLNVTVKAQDEAARHQSVKIRRPLFSSASLPLLWTPENLQPGRKGVLELWNPLILSFEKVEFHVHEKTTLLHDGENKEVYLITLKQNGMETRYWCTPEGVVLKHESPTGLTLIQEPAWRIFDSLREKRAHLADLPNLYSIPAGQKLPAPEKIAKLKVRLILPEEEKDMEIKHLNLEEIPEVSPSGQWNEKLRPYTEAGPFVQADDPEIRAMAISLAGNEGTVLAAGRKLMNWVNDSVKPAPTMSLPSAIQVLKNRQGDCNEYTVLFTALARSLGIPTRMVAGLVYRDGRFFYHAWAEIYSGEWVPVDPTFRQMPADATHIPLTRGALKEQVNLTQQIGRIQIRILAAETNPEEVKP